MLQKTLYLYLDSDNAELKESSYKFSLQPSIESYFASKTSVYLKDFRSRHTIGNIRGSQEQRTFSLRCHYSGKNESDPSQFIVFENNVSFTDGRTFAAFLNNKFNTSTNTNENVEFTWINYMQKMQFRASQPNTTVSFFQNEEINTKFLKFEAIPSSNLRTGLSSSEIDLCTEIHSLYVYCDEITPEPVQSANEKTGVICKIPIDSRYGSYIDYNNELPIHKSSLDKNTTNHLTLSFMDDSGLHFKPNRFTITLCIEMYNENKNELKNNYLVTQTDILGR